MSINEDEIREYLENKKLKEITLPQNSNDIDQGSDTAKEEKIGQKSSTRIELELERKQRKSTMEYLIERDKKIKFGDPQAIAEYMQEAEARRQKLEQQKILDREDYDYREAQKKRLAIEAKITPEDRESEAKDIQKLERKRDKEIANIQDYFNSSDEFWQEYQHNGHDAYESPAAALIAQTDRGYWACAIHRYQPVFESANNDGRLVAASITIDGLEDHFRKYEPEKHKAAIIDNINEKYDKLIQERKEKTYEDKEVAFRREIRDINNIKTRGDADWSRAARKLTKGDKARIREAEESEAEKNRRIYSGLY
jgi:hypothetical protein